MCGRIKGYQYDGTDGFEAYQNSVVTTIDGAYVSGVSLTHGSPRQPSGHLQLVILSMILLKMMPVLVILPSILPSHHLWVETIL